MATAAPSSTPPIAARAGVRAWGVAALTAIAALYLSGVASWLVPALGQEREAGWVALVWAAAVAAAVRLGDPLERMPLIVRLLQALRNLDSRRMAAVAALFTLAWGALGARRFDAFVQRAFDLSIFDQAIWTTAQGSLLFSSLKGDIVLLGDHSSPILAAIAPLYRLVPDSRLLYFLQAGSFALAAIAVLRLARTQLGPGALAALFPLAFLLQGPLQGLMLHEFHPEVFAVPLLLFALVALVERRVVTLFVLAALALTCKETTALAVAGLGLVAFTRRWWSAGLALVALGVATFAFDVLYVIPHYLGHGTPYVGRYSHLGGSMSEVLLSPVLRPLDVLKYLVVPTLKLEGVARLLLPFGLTGLGGPGALLGALPNYLANAMSNAPTMWNVRAQYHCEEMAFVAAASVFGTAKLLKRWPTRRRWIAGLVAACALAQIGRPWGVLWVQSATTERTRLWSEQLAKLPVDVAVSADTQSATHLAHRFKLFLFPDRLAEAQCVAVDTRVVDHAWHASPEQTKAAIDSLPAMGFAPRFEQDGLLVACRRPAEGAP
ncbi:MAG: DUF2079 domain-containing protein [Myxococcales bacterium]